MGAAASECNCRKRAHVEASLEADPGEELEELGDLEIDPLPEPVIEHEETESKLGWDLIEQPLQEDWVRLVRASWLVELAESGGVLQRRQDLPREAFVGFDELRAAGPGKYVLGTCLRIIVLSYPWLHPTHPDPHGENLRAIAKALRLYVDHRENGGKPYGVFIDFTGLPQVPRTNEESRLLKKAFSRLSIFYSHPQTIVLKISTFPEGYPNKSSPSYNLPEGSNAAAYGDRGWCFAESSMAGLVKSCDKVLDLDRVRSDTDLLGAIIASRVGRTPPVHPDDLRSQLGGKTFTHKVEDFDTVAGLYASAFREHLESATELDYSGQKWDADAVRKLLHALRHNKCLQSLNLGDNRVGLVGSLALVQALRSTTSLLSLELPNSNLGPKCVAVLGQALEANTTLQCLNLYKNEIGSEGAAKLGEALKCNKSLQELNLRHNHIGHEGAVALGEALRKNSSLQSLQLYGNDVGPKGAAALAEALQNNASLLTLRLGENEILTQGATALGQALRSNKCLQRLDLRGNDISGDVQDALQEALRNNSSLLELDLRDNHIGPESVTALREAASAQTRLLV